MRTWARRVGLALLFLAVLVAGAIAWQWRGDLPLDQLEAHWATGASRFVDLDGMRVHYRDEGRGTPVVLLHGTGASLHTCDAWAAVMVHDGRRVVRLDLPGFGLTGPPPAGDYRIDYYVEFLERFFTRVGLDRFALGGNSLGGNIAWRYAVAHPERLTALILVDAAGFPLTGSHPLVFRLGRMPVVATLMAHLDPRWLVARTLRQTYGDPSRVTPAIVDRYTELTLRPGNRAAFGARTAVPYEDRTRELTRLKLPVLIVWGGRDRLIPVEHARRFAAAIAGAESAIYDDLGHVPMEEDGGRTVFDVEAFLARNHL